jgi:hypothetical protein
MSNSNMQRAILVSLLLSTTTTARAAQVDDTCTLKADLPVVVRGSSRGRLETTWLVGTEVRITAVGDGGGVQVTDGASRASAFAVDIEAACAGTLQICVLKKDVALFSQTRTDAVSTPVLQGQRLSRLRAGQMWSDVRVHDGERGFIKVADIKNACQRMDAALVKEAASSVVERGDGPGIALFGFRTDASTTPAAAKAQQLELWQALSRARPDSVSFLDEVVPQNGPALAKASAAGVRFALMATAKQTAELNNVVEIALYDVAAKKAVKGIRLPHQEGWAEEAVRQLWGLWPASPGQVLPAEKHRAFEVARVH